MVYVVSLSSSYSVTIVFNLLHDGLLVGTLLTQQAACAVWGGLNQ